MTKQTELKVELEKGNFARHARSEKKKKKTAYAEAYDSQDHLDTTFRQGRYIVEKSNAVHGQFLIHVAEVSYLSKK